MGWVGLLRIGLEWSMIYVGWIEIGLDPFRLSHNQVCFLFVLPVCQEKELNICEERILACLVYVSKFWFASEQGLLLFLAFL